jgi:ring-1,2-phenylacetyl-CoA epoxidase subunit PaaC
MSTSCSGAPAWHVETVLRLGDDALVLGQRVAQWCGHGPLLEEELAMANIGLDLLGQARLLLDHAGRLEGAGRDEDRLAYFRDEAAFRNHAICELPNGRGPHDDYAVTIVRNLLCAARSIALWPALAASTDPTLAAIAAKAAKESIGHWRHAADWTVRFGDGTDESHTRAQRALARLWPYTHEFWLDDAIDEAAVRAGVACLPSSLRADWEARIEPVLAEATLSRPTDSGFVSRGKQGRHTEHFGYLLAEMQSVARADPQARW